MRHNAQQPEARTDSSTRRFCAGLLSAPNRQVARDTAPPRDPEPRLAVHGSAKPGAMRMQPAGSAPGRRLQAGRAKPRSRCLFGTELEVRIHFPPSDSPCLARTGPRQVTTHGFPAGVRRWAGGAVGRDAQGSSTSRQLPIISLSGPFPVPQCRLSGSPTVVAPAHQARSG